MWFQSWAALLKIGPGGLLDDVVQAHVLEFGPGDELVEVVHVGGVVLAVVIVDRLLGDVRGQGVGGKGQVRQLVLLRSGPRAGGQHKRGRGANRRLASSQRREIRVCRMTCSSSAERIGGRKHRQESYAATPGGTSGQSRLRRRLSQFVGVVPLTEHLRPRGSCPPRHRGSPA